MAVSLVSKVAGSYHHHQKPGLRAPLKMIKIAEKVNLIFDLRVIPFDIILASCHRSRSFWFTHFPINFFIR
jgi:hypothetical protein